MRSLFANLCLLLVSCVTGLALCEVSLRLFYPKYRHLAEAPFRSDAMRIWARTPNHRDIMVHPDTGLPHSLYHNNLALRQHRNFSEADLAAAINIGVFGDSFTENIRLPVPYSFTEPLDYLLNESGNVFNVLNFGVGGYGPGQSFLHYENFRYVDDLDYVVFLFFKNDIRNIYETNLFSLDVAGQLKRNEAIQPSRWGKIIQHLHISYLLLDVSGKLSSFIEEAAVNEKMRTMQRERYFNSRATALYQNMNMDNKDFKEALDIFRRLVRRWKQLVEQLGGRFYILTVPDLSRLPGMTDIFNEGEQQILHLHDCYRDYDDTFHWREWQNSPYRFKNDHHWNEAGNRLAAVCLYRLLEEEMGLPRLSEGKLQEALFQYYAAFGRGDPSEAGEQGEEAERPRSGEDGAAIREKYLALDMAAPLEDLKDEIRNVVAQRDKRIIASVFDVYLDRNHLIYVKEECRPADMPRAHFFLHVRPVDERDLPERRRPHGFDNMDFTQTGMEIGDRRCVIRRRLPAWPIRQISTGQFVRDDQGNYVHLWEGEFSMTQGTGVGERRAGN